MGVITFNGIQSKDYDIQIERQPDYQIPEKDYDIIHIPGKNGDVLIDKGSYKNITRIYNIAIGSLYKDFTPMANTISEWLHSASGYARLEDSYEPEYYRLAMYKDQGLIENILGNAGRTTISFNCKPQRFLKLGDYKVTFLSTGILHNPTGFTASPIITVYGSGSGVLRVGGYIITISAIDEHIVVNSEIQDAYKGASNLNSVITLSNDFPKLQTGNNEVSFTGGITSVEIIPKWWTI